MTPSEHRQISLRLLELSERLFNEDEKVLGAEALWGAAIHSVNAVAMQNNLSHGNYRQKSIAVRLIADRLGDEDILISGFKAARNRLHVYFDKVHLEDSQLLSARGVVRNFISKMLEIHEDSVLNNR